MSLFKCDVCGCVENTALCNYWQVKARQDKRLCSACNPSIGQWHGEFPQVQPHADMFVDVRGFLWDSRDQCPENLRGKGHE